MAVDPIVRAHLVELISVAACRLNMLSLLQLAIVRLCDRGTNNARAQRASCSSVLIRTTKEHHLSILEPISYCNLLSLANVMAC